MGLVAASFPSARAEACSVCGCGDPDVASNDPVALVGRLRVQMETEYLSMKAGSEDDPAATDKLDQYSARLRAMARPTARVVLLASLPWTRKKLATDGVVNSDLSGLGDAELGARITLITRLDSHRGREQAIDLTTGTSFPTGANNAVVNGERADEHGQLGTGSFGPYAGLQYRLSQASWSGYASLTGRVRTTNDFSYRYGRALLWSAHAQERPARAAAFELGIDGRAADADRDGGEAVPSTGGTLMALMAGTYWNAGGPVWLAARAQVPVYSSLLGRQSVGPTISLGLQYQLVGR